MRSGTGAIGTAALLLAVATGACAGHLPPCPAAGGPAWTELQGAHFRLRTDGDAAAGRAALDDLEQFQAALLTVFGAPANHDTGRMPVIIVDRGWTDFAPHRVNGYTDDWLAWLLVATASPGRDGGADQNDALAQALDLATRDPSIHIPVSGEEK